MRDSTRTALVATVGCLATAVAGAAVHDGPSAALFAGVAMGSATAINWSIRKGRHGG